MKENDILKSKDTGIGNSEEINKKIRKKEEASENNFFKEWIIPIIAAIGIAILINRFCIYNVYIPSESMVPTLNIGDKLMVTRIYNTDKIKRGNVVVFYSNELQETVIKRVIGIPGDHIEIKKGVVNVNGEDIEEDYVKNNEYLEKDLVFDVPEDKFFFLGDNRIRSNDARKWINPYIDASDIKGRAVLKYSPLKDFGSIR